MSKILLLTLDGEPPTMVEDTIAKLREGGAGSGNHGHIGRPGAVGGSGPTTADYMHKIAVLHQNAVHDPTNPDVKNAYDSFKAQVLQQYHTLKDKGEQFEFTDKDPYATSKQMRDDALGNKHLAVYNQAPDLQADHPLNAPAEDGQTYNTIFRGVHDYYGHAIPGNQFGPKGELAAYQAHAKMFSSDALPALAAETLAQNAWVNYATGHQDLAPRDRPFAEQKAYAFPKDLALHVAHGRFPQWLGTMREAERVRKPNTVDVTVPINTDSMEDEDYRRPRNEAQLREGGPGSGNFGHAGRPGSVGGSTSNGGEGLIRKARTLLNREGGFTLSTHGEATPKEGYSVGGYGVANEDGTQYTMTVWPTSVEAIRDFRNKNADVLAREGNFLGGWKDSANQAALDVSRVFESRSDALATALDHREEAVWDFKNEESVYVRKDKSRPQGDETKDQLNESQRAEYVKPRHVILFGNDATDEEIVEAINNL